MILSIIMVHYRTPELLIDCLRSIAHQDFRSLEVIVIDNENSPRLPEQWEAYPFSFKFIQNTENIGFGQAVNQGAELAKGEILFLLNPDTLLLTPNILSDLLSFHQAHPEFGLIGPRIADQAHGTLLPRLSYPGLKYVKTPLFQNLPGHIAWLLGAAMLIPKPFFDRIGGFDPDYFLYGEEVDLCLRLRQAGFAIGYCEEVEISHVGGASEKATPEYDYWLKKQSGLYLFYGKHYPESVRRFLIRRDLRRAQVRLALLWLQAPFYDKRILHNKQGRNKAIRDAARQAITLKP